MAADPRYIAVLTVDGRDYTDWETVLVKHQLRTAPLYYCRFTCSEGSPLTKNWGALQIMPGAACTVTLGGLLAFTGKVTTRQVFYDAKKHHIEIQAANLTEIMVGSVVTQTGEWKDKTLETIIKDVLKPVKLNLVVEGGKLPDKPIPVVRSTPGESIHDFIDHLVRSVGSSTSIGVSFTSNVKGDFVLVIGQTGGTDNVTEGVNIIEGRETIYDPYMGQDVVTSSQAPATNKIWGAHVASIPFAQETLKMLGKMGAPAVVISELPTAVDNVIKGRTTTERNWMMEDFVTVFATVYGWSKPSGGLWLRGQTVIVNSPMLVMNGISLTLKSVTFSQDNRTGTRTVLELVNANVLSQLAPTEQQ
jgi:prophage tail gpP-like protein